LQQCIHNGFGLHEFKEELTGPEYAGRFIREVLRTDIEFFLNTMVLDISDKRIIRAVNMQQGVLEIHAGAVILAMGCRERTRGAIAIPGERPAGIFTAGAAQRYINLEGYMVGRKILILGSGDIGLIMARRLTLEGAEVKAVVELLPFSGGLARNIAQCLNDYDIPLFLNHTVVDIRGRERLEKVVIARVDENRSPVPGTEREYEVDTLLLSVGLIPENDISRKTGILLDPRTQGPVVNEMMETSVDGIFACGNVVHVHDLVDFVSAEARKAGRSAAKYIKRLVRPGEYRELTAGRGIAYTVPQKFRPQNLDGDLELFLRVKNIYKNRSIEVKDRDRTIYSQKRPHLAPGEMERLLVPQNALTSLSGDPLSVELSGGGEQ
jgi:NADPH-dependent 2,4-dienoyl-CoA reductase/sulfur reductase-like enzyme